MSRLFRDEGLTVGGVTYNTDVALRDTLPTAYSPATLQRSRPSGIEDPDPARLTVDVTVPATTRPNLVPNPSFEDGVDGVLKSVGVESFFPSAFANGVLSGEQCMAFQIGTNQPALSTLRQDIGAVSPGQWVSVAIPARWSGYTGRFRAGIQFRDAGGVLLNSAGAYTPAASSSYRLATHSAQAPAGTATAWVLLYLAGETAPDPDPSTQGHTDGWIACTGATQAAAEAGVSWFHEGTGTPQLGDTVRALLNASDQSPGAEGTEAFYGAVQSISRQPRTMRLPDGTLFDVVVHRLDATDWTGVAARRTVGSTPFPEETVTARWERIRALVPDLPMVPFASSEPTDRVAARDVDNVSVLALLRDTCTIADLAVYTSPLGIDNAPRDSLNTPPDVWDLNLPEADRLVAGGSQFAMVLPGQLVTDPGDLLDYDLLVNVAAVTGKRPDPDEPGQYIDTTATHRNDPSRSRHGEARWSTSGDGLDVPASPAARRAARFVTIAGEPAYRLADAVNVLAYRIGRWWEGVPFFSPTALNPVISSGLGGLPLVRITDAPPGRDLWRIVDLTLSWGSEDDEQVTFEVEPYELAAPGGLTFADTRGFDPEPDLTFADLRPMTFAQARRVEHIERVGA